MKSKKYNKMKKLIIIVFFASISFTNAQVIIGDAIGTAKDKTSVLLEFAANKNKGIIVPYVRILPKLAALVEGSIILDVTNATTARMKFYNGTIWKDLSGQDANLIVPINFMTAQPTALLAPETTSSKVIIGSSTTSADGVLVLESNTKALVLPTVSDVQNIPSPSPGMMVYVNKTGAKRLAVFNGNKWSFWKP